ncbi:MAG TPA: hypothetical protein VFU15_10505, partial [Bacteroidia bacterium]|nr:hypothetical protein [Bacteroidia bacterium]
MAKRRKEKTYSLTAFAWQRLRRNKLALSGIGIIAFSILISILGYLITPDKSPDADTHIDEIGIKRPGFSCNLIRLRKNTDINNQSFIRTMLFGRVNDYEYHAYKNYWFSGNDILWEEYNDGPGIPKIWRYNLADAIYPINPAFQIKNDTINGVMDFYAYGETRKMHKTVQELRQEILGNIYHEKFLLGTDHFGRDLLSRLMIGTRISLF